MATHTLLTGATDATAGASYDTGTAPGSWAAGDILIVPDGTAAPTSIATAWTASGNALARALFGPECSRPIGGSGTNAAIEVTNSTGNLDYYARGIAFFAATANIIDVRSPSSAPVHLPTGAVTNLRMQSGAVVKVGEAMGVTNYHKQGGNLDISAYGANKVTLGYDFGGTTISRRTLDTLYLAGPRDDTGSQQLFVLDGSAKIDVDLFAFGGKYQHRSSGVIDRAYFGRYSYATAEGAKNDVTVSVATIVSGARVVKSSSGIVFNTSASLTEIGDVNGLGV